MQNPTTVSFRGENRSFDSSKEAYIWLLGRFLGENPSLLANNGTIAQGRRRKYFAKAAEELWEQSQHLVDSDSSHKEITPGWFINLNINNEVKFDVLNRLARAEGYTYGTDWTFEDGSNYGRYWKSNLSVDDF